MVTDAVTLKKKSLKRQGVFHNPLVSTQITKLSVRLSPQATFQIHVFIIVYRFSITVKLNIGYTVSVPALEQVGLDQQAKP